MKNFERSRNECADFPTAIVYPITMNKLLLCFFLCAAGLLNAQEIDVLHYRFDIDVNDRNDTLRGKTAIAFRLLQEAKAITLDLTAPNENGQGMKITAAIFSGDPSKTISVQQSPQNFTIPLPSAKKGDTLTLFLSCEGIPDDGLIISKNKFGERTFFADNWPNRAHHWLPCNDRPDDKASFEFFVTAPARYRVVANGQKEKEETTGNGSKQTHWSEPVALSTKVMAVGIARFAVKTYADSPKDIPVSAWVYPKDSTKGFTDFAVAPLMVRFFSDYIAPFPYSKLANVQSTTIFGGMENASCIFYDEKLVTGDRSSESTVAHEIAHQWFGDMASEKSFAHLWLSEGFATYFAHLWFEKKYGKEAFYEKLEESRVKVIDFMKESNHPVVDSTADLMSLLNANSYDKGAWVLHMLRNEVGDESFQQIVRSYYNQYKGGNAETRDFEAVADAISGKTLHPFFNQWLYQPGIPVVKVTPYLEKEVLLFTVLQLQESRKQFSLEIEVIDTDGSRTRFVETVSDRKQVFRHEFRKRIKSIVLDPDKKLLFEEVGSN